MATYEKMVLISEAEYLNMKNFKYLPHELDDDDDDGGESGYGSGYGDDDEDESGYHPGRVWRQPQTPEERHIQTPSPTRSVRSADFPPVGPTIESGAPTSSAESIERGGPIESPVRAAQLGRLGRRERLDTSSGTSVARSIHFAEDADALEDVAAAIRRALPTPPPLERLNIRTSEREDLQELRRLRRDHGNFEAAKRRILAKNETRNVSKANKWLQRQRYLKLIKGIEHNTELHTQIAQILNRWRRQSEAVLPVEIEAQITDEARVDLEDNLRYLNPDLRVVLRRLSEEEILHSYEAAGYDISNIGAELEVETFDPDEADRQLEYEQRLADEEEAQRLADEEYAQHLEDEEARAESDTEARGWAEHADDIEEEEERLEAARRFNEFLDRMARQDEQRFEDEAAAEQRAEEDAQMENEADTSAMTQSAGDDDYDLSNVPRALQGHARQLLEELQRRDIIWDSNIYAHEADPNPTQMNIDTARFLQLAVRNTHRADNNLSAGPRTVAAIGLLKFHADRDPTLTSYLGETVLRDLRREYGTEIRPSAFTPRVIKRRAKKPQKPLKVGEKSTVLHYSDKHNFPRPSDMKRITPKKPEPRSKKAKLDVGKRLQEIAQHDELLRREGVAAAERARGRLAALRGQNEPPTFRQAHADRAAVERARLMGPQLPPTHGYRLHR